MQESKDPKQFIPDILFFFFLLPILLIIVFYTYLNELFTLDTTNYNFFTIYASNFAHLDFSHFIGNLFSYMFIILIIFFFCRLLGFRERNNFYLDMVVIFIFVPFVISSIGILVYDKTKILGFSGVVSALLGYFTASFIIYTYKKANIDLNRTILFLFPVVFFNLLALSLFRYGLVENSGLYLLLILVLSIYLLDEAKYDILKIYNLFKKMILECGKIRFFPFTFYAIAVVFFFFIFTVGLWFILFPEQIINDGDRTNLQGHYMGYLIGTLAPVITYNLKAYITTSD